MSDDNCRVNIRGRYVRDDGWSATVSAPGGWADLQEGVCRDCGGRWVWDEGGHVPGTRTCVDCGSMFNVGPAGEGIGAIRRERFWSEFWGAP